jgi:hypothetical protein
MVGMFKRYFFIRIVLSMSLVLAVASGQQALSADAKNADLKAGIHELYIATVWSGQPTGFALLTRGDQQYVAYYAANSKMTVAQRTLGQKEWKYTVLPTAIGWDSHNYVTMAFDRDGFLHVSGNMHVKPLIYFRSTKPGDASSLVQVPAMTGKNETRCTYPVFSYAKDGALLFQYRFGQSGAGDTYRNRYDEKTKTWMPLTEQPLFEGGSIRNAYPLNPLLGPDGWYHQVWVWRETPDASSNHDLSYARSRNLVKWETAGGVPLKLPLTVETPGIIVDPSPEKGGLLNGTQAIGFDAKGKMVLSYTRYDAKGNTQLYFARWQKGWKIQQASNWEYRWEFSGGGSLPHGDVWVMVGPLKASNGKLSLTVRHSKYGSGIWDVDAKTMKLIGDKPTPDMAIEKPVTEESPVGQLSARSAVDLGGPKAGGASYKLTWMTLDANRDRPRPNGPPPPSMLRLLVSE